MWHASVSVQHRKRGPIDDEGTCERAAVDALRGVGGASEWWYWNTTVRVGHLRVPVTASEDALIPPGMAIDDAGESGPRRTRTP